MTIDPPVLAPPRFQFTLRDTYLVLGLVCAAFGLGELLRGGVSVYDRPTREAVAVGALVVTCLGACLGLWRARERRWMGATNFGGILTYVPVLWAGGYVCLYGSVLAGCLAVAVTVSAAWAGRWLGERTAQEGGCVICAGGAIVLAWLALGSCANDIFFPPHHCSAIAPVWACVDYAEAQEIYRRSDWDSDGVLEYTPSVTGANSLFEKNAGSGDLTLVDAGFAAAVGDPGTAVAKAGYVFKVLTRQGPNAPGGDQSYFDERGNLTGGFALMAIPANYGVTGRFSYLVNQSGIVYLQDLGEETAKIYLETDAYDPDDGWVIAE